MAASQRPDGTAKMRMAGRSTGPCRRQAQDHVKPFIKDPVQVDRPLTACTGPLYSPIAALSRPCNDALYWISLSLTGRPSFMDLVAAAAMRMG